MPDFQCISIQVKDHVAQIALNRPEKANAVNETMWFEIQAGFEWADQNPEVRAVVLEGNGKHFCGGIDFSLIQVMLGEADGLGEGRRQEAMGRTIARYQQAFSSVAYCGKPVLVAVHGSCIGAGVDLISAGDMRYATADAQLSIKEVDLGIVADVGSLQRLPHIIGDGILRELAYTGRNFSGDEALSMGLVNRVYADREAMMADVLGLAAQIATKSPLVTRGIKKVINYARDNDVEACLAYTAERNSSLLLSPDTREAFTAMMQRRAPVFEN